MTKIKLSLLSASVVLALGAMAPAHAVDADAAKALAKSNDCLKCHRSSTPFLRNVSFSGLACQ